MTDDPRRDRALPGAALRRATTPTAAGLSRPALAWLAGGAALGLLAGEVRLRRRLGAYERRLLALRDELDAMRRRGERLADQLRAEARTDPLTGIPNLRHWREQVLHELDRSRRTQDGLAVALVDLDRFKDVNDRLGHAAGDALLREVARQFAEAVRSVDLVARVGGEEFAVALPAASAEDAVRIVERLRRSVPLGVTCSAGLAVWDGQESAEELQRRADVALYRAKDAGRDRLVVAS